MTQIADPEILRFLSLSLSPVIIIGIGILVIKLSRKTSTKHDESEDWKL